MHKVRAGDVTVGDVILNENRMPVFRVEGIYPAAAPHYVIFVGTNLVTGKRADRSHHKLALVNVPN